MIDFIRPAARRALRRWGEPLIAAAITALGAFWALTSYGLVQWLGWLIIVLGLALLWSALQRARFNTQGAGPGVVQVVEGEIRFFGPRGGGFAAIDSIVALSLSADTGFWLIEAEDGQILVVPRAATGAEALFDAFTRLPGLDMESLLRSLAQDPAARAHTIWRRTTRTLLT
ncbi:hypothetical protein [Pararhodobacter sp.]|uniref:hypothetical protein n=1 Tax=Pararhodobacter sp. TaxID=2127056 RepID=UPI002B000871|nr:hypothetical protein [Pararhodobacter sp.]